MFDVRRILGMRPRSESVADITAAISGAEEARASALSRIDDLEAGRPALLAGGTEAEIVTAETSLASAKAEAEQLAGLVTGLAPRLQLAVHHEQVAELRALSAKAEAASDAFFAFMSRDYPALVSQIGVGMRLEGEALRIRETIVEKMNRAPAAAAEAEVGTWTSPAQRIFPASVEARTGLMTVAGQVRLPSPPGAAAA